MTSELTVDTRLESAKNTAWWLYLLHAVAFVFSAGTLSLLVLIVNYIQRPSTEGTFVYSHHSWQIRTFWWYLVWFVLGVILAATFVGLILAVPIWVAAWLWSAYRLVRGILDLNAGKAMP